MNPVHNVIIFFDDDDDNDDDVDNNVDDKASMLSLLVPLWFSVLASG